MYIYINYVLFYLHNSKLKILVSMGGTDPLNMTNFVIASLNQVKKELGGDAVIMSNKKTSEGIEIVAAYDQANPEPVSVPSFQIPKKAQAEKGSNANYRQVQSTHQTATKSQQVASEGKSVPSLSEIIGDSGPDSLRELLEKQNADSTQTSNDNSFTNRPVKSTNEEEISSCGKNAV